MTSPMRCHVFVAVALVVNAGCDRAPAPTTPPSASPTTVTSVSPPLEPLQFVERTTRGAPADARLPMVVALHGLGDTAPSFAEAFAGLDVAARVIVLEAPTPYVDGFSWFPLASDRKTTGPGIVAAADRVVAMVRYLEQQRPTRGKAIVTGFSQGGAIAYALAARYPADFAASFPIGGWMTDDVRPVAKPDAAPRIVGFHGSRDTRIDVAEGRAAVRAFQEAWGAADIVEDPEAGHTISPTMRLALFRNVREVVETLPE